jgi:transcriptional regulator with PAS, ATPase and Fis domain
VVHEEDKHQPGQTAEYLLAKIDTLDRIACVQQRLQQKMNESRIIAKSRPMQDVLQKLPQLASTVSTVLITGETGTGKELIARAIHYLGERAGKPFITVDCGSIPETLIENELFGHVRGAYTTANTTTHGLIQEAEGGTVFLDEVEALPLSVQTKFLRFLQERQVRQLGQTKYNPIDVRIVSSTNGNLKDFVERSLFRQDLYYRLNVIPVYLPPLRDRKADIPDLVRYFVNRHTNGAPCGITIPDDVMQRWIEHDWPGNVRELENRVQEWLIQKTADTSSYTSLSTMSTSGEITTLGKVRDQALERSEQLYLRQLLSLTNGNISQAAKLAGIDRKNLAILLKKRGVDPRGFRHQ